MLLRGAADREGTRARSDGSAGMVRSENHKMHSEPAARP